MRNCWCRVDKSNPQHSGIDAMYLWPFFSQLLRRSNMGPSVFQSRFNNESLTRAESTVDLLPLALCHPGIVSVGPAHLSVLIPCSINSSADLQKAIVILDPEWIRVLQEDNVTLRCQGTYPPEDNSTKWFHNETLIPHKDSSYFIENARVRDGGEYRCQTGLSNLSDPVLLEVHVGWLLLQTSQWVFQVGEPIHMKCHSWRNKPVYKVTYLQNGKVQRYFHQNSEFCIPEATHNYSGSYFCRGIIGRNNKSSDTVKIIVQGPTSPSIALGFSPWHQITFCLLIGLMFLADTVLYFSVQRNLRSSMKSWKESTFQWSQEPQDK